MNDTDTAPNGNADSSAPALAPFTGRFYCVTQRSIYQISIHQGLTASPTLMKVARRPEEIDPKDRRAGAYVLGKFLLAITKDGIQRYSIVPHQRTLLGQVPLPQIDSVPKKLRGLKTSAPVGLFLDRWSADECYEHSRDAKPFDLRWMESARETIRAIGDRHPYVSIAPEVIARCTAASVAAGPP